jgi:hypothetical protein
LNDNDNIYNINYDKNDKILQEYISYDKNKNKYIADIVILNNDNIKYIFEIKHTHQTITDIR